MNRIPTVVIGAGHLGTIHTRLACSLEEWDVIGIVDPSTAARERVCSQLSVAGFASLEELPRKPHAAIVAAPTALHHDVGCRLMDQGIHVLMEKPIAVDSTQARRMLETAQRRGTILQVGHVERFNPAFNHLLQYVDRAKYIQTRRFSEYTFRSTDVGVVLDLMIHDLDLVLSLVDADLERVDAIGISVMGEHEDIAQARLEFANGTVANLEVSRCSFERERSIQVFSDRGFVQADLTSRKVTSIVPRDEMLARSVDFLGMAATERDQVKAELFTQWLPRREETADEANAILEEQRDFARAIRTKTSPRVSGQAGARALAVAERVIQEIAEHAWYGKSLPSRGPLAMPLPRIVGGQEHHEDSQLPAASSESVPAASITGEPVRRAG